MVASNLSIDVSYVKPVFTLDYIQPILKPTAQQSPSAILDSYMQPAPAIRAIQYDGDDILRLTIWDNGTTVWDGGNTIWA